MVRSKLWRVLRWRSPAPTAVRVLATLPTFAVVVVVVGVIFGDSTSAPVISGVVAAMVADAVLALVWVRRQRSSR